MSSLASSMSSSLREAIFSLNAFTGLDTTSYFAGKGKERPLKTLKKDQSVIDVFARLGTTEEVSTADRSKLEAFVCALYGKETYSSVDKLRYIKVRQSFKGMKSILSSSDGVDRSQMPPCDQVLQLHYIKSKLPNPCVEEVTCLTFFYLPDPTENGWVDSPSEELAIQRFSDNFLSRDLLSEVDDDNDKGGVREDDSERITSESDTNSSPSDEDCSNTEDELKLKMC